MATAFYGFPDSLAGDLAALRSDLRISFGEDIDEAERILLNALPIETKKRSLMDWLVRNSPCVFARVGAQQLRGVELALCWLDRGDLDRGEDFVTARIQDARRQWKDRAAEGGSSAFLIMFNDARLARALPDHNLVRLMQRLAACYLIERAPIETDLIYTEAIPLRDAEGWSLFRAGVNFFYATAHETANHDRRVPGGLLISVNSPGHLAHCQVQSGYQPSFEEAVRNSLRLAKASVGNGGIGSGRMGSCSWHNMIEAGATQVSSDRDYSAVYHTDVLIPTMATIGRQANDGEIWDGLRFDYISTERLPRDHINYGLFRGHRIVEQAKYDNPWPPRRPDTLEDLP
jgi:hypothetical protein